MLEEYWMKKKREGMLWSVVRHVYAMLVVTVGFVIFRADTLAQGLFFIKEMFTGLHFEAAAMSLGVQQLTPLYLTVLVVCVVAALPIKKMLKQKRWYEPLAWGSSLVGLVLCMLSLSGSTYNPFIYFRF